MLFNSRPRVLCVDDDEDSRVMLITLLRLALIEAKAVGTAAQALSLIQTERFDLYLLDGWLPGLDGFELCRQMRALDPHTPILFFSGAAYEADKKRGIEAGANAYVVKPDVDGLVGSITQLVSNVEGAMAKIIPFRPKMSFSTPFAFEPAAA
jgi:DNA-binding response OmpR family regulator